jgi:hypothetical protein
MSEAEDSLRADELLSRAVRAENLAERSRLIDEAIRIRLSSDRGLHERPRRHFEPRDS